MRLIQVPARNVQQHHLHRMSAKCATKNAMTAKALAFHQVKSTESPAVIADWCMTSFLCPRTASPSALRPSGTTEQQRQSAATSGDKHMSEWISVKDRLPEDRKAVLIRCPEIKCSFTAIWREGTWEYFGASSQPVRFEVTHWQPLPPPPETAPKPEWLDPPITAEQWDNACRGLGTKA